tara:strand:+ start:483 stop:1379 length:897 start_codon:yes stop_codon:yes gene_type:complete
MQLVDIPVLEDVCNVLKNQNLSNLNYRIGDGQAVTDLELVEKTHRKWVSEIIDLSEFTHCYFVNGLADAIHHWKIIETRPWQKLEGEYSYPDNIGSPSTVCCDVPGQYMNEDLGRSAIPAVIDKNKPLYISIPSHADGNYFNPQATGKIVAPVILDCSYVGSTSIQKIDIPQNTEQVFFEFSRSFGLVAQGIGLVYTKKPHPTLQKLKELEEWNYVGVKMISALISNFSVDEMWKKHNQLQNKICENYQFKPASCFYLATTRDPEYKEMRYMRWNDTAKICITWFFDDHRINTHKGKL